MKKFLICLFTIFNFTALGWVAPGDILDDYSYMLPYGFELEQTSVTYSINAGTAVYSQNSDLLDGLDSSEFLQLVASQTITGQPVWQNTILGTATYSLDGNLLNGTSNYLRNDIDDIDLGNITSSNTTPTFTWHTTEDGCSATAGRVEANGEFKITNKSLRPGESYAVDFPGTASDFIDASGSAVLEYTDEFTITAWVNLDFVDSRGVPLEFYSADQQDFIAIQQWNAGAGDYRFHIFVDGSILTLHSDGQPPSGWHFLVGIRDLIGGCSFYINDVQQAEIGNKAGTIILDGTLRFGKARNSLFPFNGQLDDVILYDYAISRASMTILYNAGAGLYKNAESGMDVFFRFDDGEGVTATESSGNNLNGTLNGSITWVAPHIVAPTQDLENDVLRNFDATNPNYSGHTWIGSRNGTNYGGLTLDAKSINFAIEGVVKATWTATGLGIGTDNARTLLDVNDDITVNGDIIAGDSNGTGLKEQTGVDGLDIDNNGNGIFTKSLDVQGDDGIDSTYNVNAATFTATVYMESPLFKGSTIQPLTDTGNVHIGTSAANGTDFEPDGTMVFKGKATVFRDIKMYLTSGKRGANAKPDFDEANVGYLFPQNDVSEILYLIVQIPSGYKEGEDLIPHIHWLQTSISTATFKIDYMWHNQGASTTSFTTLQCDEGEFNYTSGAMHQHSNFPAISGTGKTIGSSLQFRLYRDDNFVSGDVLTWEFDLHYEKNTAGSRTSTSK